MGWVWKDDNDDDTMSSEANQLDDSNPRSDNQCSTRKIINSHCRTEEVEPGKFVRKCEKTEQHLKNCVGRPSVVVQSNKEYTEEDVTEEVMKGTFPSQSSELGPFGFPGLHGDIEAIERSLFGSMNRFFEAAEDVKNHFLVVFGAPHLYDGNPRSSPSTRPGVPIEGEVLFGDPHLYDGNPRSSPSTRPGVPIEGPPTSKEVSPKLNSKVDGHIDLSELARDV